MPNQTVKMKLEFINGDLLTEDYEVVSTPADIQEIEKCNIEHSNDIK